MILLIQLWLQHRMRCDLLFTLHWVFLLARLSSIVICFWIYLLWPICSKTSDKHSSITIFVAKTTVIVTLNMLLETMFLSSSLSARIKLHRSLCNKLMDPTELNKYMIPMALRPSVVVLALLINCLSIRRLRPAFLLC
jgi:hypothetical protein